MQEVIANFLRGRYVDHYRENKPSERRGNVLTGGVPGGAYPCAPGGLNDYVYVYGQPINPEMWRAFATTSGREDLTDGPARQGRQGPLAAPRRAQRDLPGVDRRAHQARGLGHSRQGWRPLRRHPGHRREILDDPHLNARNQIDTIDHPTRGRFRLPACPVRLSGSETPTLRPPLVGEHTTEILNEVLGLSKDDAEAPHARGAM